MRDAGGVSTVFDKNARDAGGVSIVFDKNGYRLGYGKGYYDKYFSKNKYKTSIGLSFEKLLQEEIPKEKHDKNVDLIITEERIIVINEKHSSNY